MCPLSKEAAFSTDTKVRAGKNNAEVKAKNTGADSLTQGNISFNLHLFNNEQC